MDTPLKKPRKPRRTMRYRRAPLAIEHTGFYRYFLRYLETLRVRNYADTSVKRREHTLRRFIHWCDERGLDRPQQITKPILESYQRHLYYYRQDNGQPLSPNARGNYISNIKQFFKWLSQENHLLYNPASELIRPKGTVSLPAVLSEAEVERLLQQPDTATVYGLRDRAILELFYSAGLRRTELCHLQLSDVSLERKTVFVRQGKGGKDRLLPVGERAITWLCRYLNEARPALVVNVNEPALFLNDYGDAFRDNKLGDRVKRYLKNAGINAPGSCHLLRHAMATHMLEHGAELRFIQAMLGHGDYRATQVYTHVSIRKLQEIHAATHPAKLRTEDGEQRTESEDGGQTTEDSADLFAWLDAEAED